MSGGTTYNMGRIIIAADIEGIKGDNIFIRGVRRKGKIITVVLSIFRSEVVPKLLKSMLSP